MARAAGLDGEGVGDDGAATDTRCVRVWELKYSNASFVWALIPVSTHVPLPPLKLTFPPTLSEQVTLPSLLIEMLTGSLIASIEKVNAPAGPWTESGPVYVIVFGILFKASLPHPTRRIGAKATMPPTPTMRTTLRMRDSSLTRVDIMARR